MIKLGFLDLLDSLRKLPLAFYLAWSDTKARYRRSILGPLWLVFGTAISVAGLGFVWSTLLKQDHSKFIPSLTIGLVLWQLIGNCIGESPNLFIKNSKLIRNIKTSFFIFPIQLVIRHGINFAHNMIIVIIVLCIFPPNFSSYQLLIIPGLLLLVGNLIWISFLIGLLGARFRDLDPLITSLMPLLFFMSPVIYKPDQLSIQQSIAWLNPISYLITLIRAPLEGSPAPSFVYFLSTLALVVGWSFSLWLLGRKNGRIAFWV
jgi:ABC-type polysaccharide/polyol phosphate export permease